MTPEQWARVFRAGGRAAAPPTPAEHKVQDALEAMANEAAAIAAEEAERGEP